HRWLPILITGLFYLVFGINDFSSALFGMLTTLGTCWMIILLTRSLGKKNQILSVLLFLLTYSVIFASHRLWPDTGISFFLLCSLYLYLNRSEHKAAQNSFLFTAGLCCALLCKETVIVFIPLLLFVFIKDLTTNKLKAWWGWTVIWSISFLLLYL